MNGPVLVPKRFFHFQKWKMKFLLYRPSVFFYSLLLFNHAILIVRSPRAAHTKADRETTEENYKTTTTITKKIIHNTKFNTVHEMCMGSFYFRCWIYFFFARMFVALLVCYWSGVCFGSAYVYLSYPHMDRNHFISVWFVWRERATEAHINKE